jgi:purine-binding chemotaxis protein CheW
MEFLENITETSEDTLKGRYLTFLIDSEMYGIEIRYVMEIVGLQKITAMPEMPEYVKGIINLRGKIIPVMDIRLRFRKASRDYDDRTCVIVICYHDMFYGLIVDSVSEVLSIADEDVTDRPRIKDSEICGYIKNIGKWEQTVILLVDCYQLLSSSEFEKLFNTL